MIVSGSLNVVIYSWVNHIAKEMLPCIPGSWSFTRCFLQGTPVRWGDDSIRTVEEEGRQRHSRPGSRWGKKEKWDWRENWGKTEKPQWKAFFFQSHRKIQWLSCERKKRKSRLCGSMSRWGYQAVGLYFYPWLGRGAPWGDAGPVLDLLCPASQWGTQTLPACLFTHFSRKGQKRGEIHRSTGGFILFTWCYNCLFAYMPHLFIN